ncbi:DUF6734 family protein [Prevotella amnii]|jgi:conserved domain protein|uniref:DUF6734 domain-containing protein n=3 Tax=Prevotella amnii TaxID=419005 RepID=A0A096AVV2_9BACT|nr:DUF6734 family protein [Prevotella amnii]EFN91665.1 hypothetical protein HMPREF9018_0338 [Prevotella amnii CRIS 21A-A]KGF50836.1 hypothetical protein HMPREF9302_09450 [Prevotella amnii DNF00058]KXB81221.1 hypothetical protein HMPREF1860_00236 [Prevotella amnii]
MVTELVHSYWSKPYFRPEADKGGWNKRLFHYMSCAFSCLKFSEFHKINLVTDKHGKELFIDKIGLPYNKVTTSLDELNTIYPEYLWAIGKIYTYSLIKEPFIHVDNDIYIWKPLKKQLFESKLVAHNLEVSYPHNKQFFQDILKKFHYVPDLLKEAFVKTDSIIEINAGILGGTDISFFQEYCKLAFDFVDKNIDVIRTLERPGMFNVIYEQFLFYALAQSKNIKIEYLIDEDVDEHFLGLTDFWETPHRQQYIHAVGAYKTWYIIGEQMAHRLYIEYPDYFQRILDLYKKGEL